MIILIGVNHLQKTHRGYSWPPWSSWLESMMFKRLLFISFSPMIPKIYHMLGLKWKKSIKMPVLAEDNLRTSWPSWLESMTFKLVLFTSYSHKDSKNIAYVGFEVNNFTNMPVSLQKTLGGHPDHPDWS